MRRCLYLSMATVALVGMLCLAGCGKKTGAEPTHSFEGEPISAELLESSSKEEPEKVQRDPAAVKELLAGTWVCGRASLEITFGEDGNAMVTILWAGSAFEVMEWDYTCTFDGEKLIGDGLGQKVDALYEEENAEPVRTVIYSDGVAWFVLNEEDMLVWDDRKEDAGKDMVFEKV